MIALLMICLSANLCEPRVADALEQHINNQPVAQVAQVVYLPTTEWSHPDSVEAWRPLVTQYWGSLAERALCLMRYESGGDPTAASATDDHGLMQVHWPIWGPAFNLSRQDLYDPETNVRVARAIYDQQGWWAWSPYKRGLCR